MGGILVRVGVELLLEKSYMFVWDEKLDVGNLFDLLSSTTITSI